MGSPADQRSLEEQLTDELARAKEKIRELREELHSGKHHMAQTSGDGLMVCVACFYRRPAVGWCEEHKGLDTCWHVKMEAEKARIRDNYASLQSDRKTPHIPQG